MPKNSKKAIQAHSTFSTNRKFQKKCKGVPFDKFQKFSKKSRTVPKKIQRGDPLGTSGCVCFLEKVKTERGTESLPSAQNCRIVRKVDHSEWDCQLKKTKKKLLTVRVGLFSLREKAPTKNDKKPPSWRNYSWLCGDYLMNFVQLWLPTWIYLLYSF